MGNMKKYVNIADVINIISHEIDVCNDSSVRGELKFLEARIREIPTADVVEVTRCKDCQYSNAYLTWRGKEYYHCTANDGANVAEPTHFCGYGERKEQRKEDEGK